MVADRGFGLLKAPVKRVAVPNVCIPYAPNAEARVIRTPRASPAPVVS